MCILNLLSIFISTKVVYSKREEGVILNDFTTIFIKKKITSRRFCFSSPTSVLVYFLKLDKNSLFTYLLSDY